MSSCKEGLTTGRPSQNKPIWNIEDLMQITGMKRQTIYNRIKDIPHRKKSGRLFFFPDEILNWIDEGELE